jgi:hypothetical protein
VGSEEQKRGRGRGEGDRRQDRLLISMEQWQPKAKIFWPLFEGLKIHDLRGKKNQQKLKGLGV